MIRWTKALSDLAAQGWQKQPVEPPKPLEWTDWADERRVGLVDQLESLLLAVAEAEAMARLDDRLDLAARVRGDG